MTIEINYIKWSVGWTFLAKQIGLLTKEAEEELQEFIKDNPDADVARWANDVFYDKLKPR